MDSKNNPEVTLASHLAKPFLLPGQSGQPLSFRGLPDGGMVVIASDGRKLWFTALEVSRARKELNQPEVKIPKIAADANIPRLHDIDPRKSRLNAKPVGRTRDGMSELIVLPDDLKYLEKRNHDRSGNHQKPRTSNSG